MWSWTSRLGLGALVALVGVYVIAVLTAPGQWLDDEVFGLAQRLVPGSEHGWLPFLGRRVLPALVLAGFVLLVVRALVARRVKEVMQAVLLVVGCVLISRLLREWLPRPDRGFSYDANTLPSTHATLVFVGIVAILRLWRGRTVEMSLSQWATVTGLTVLVAAGNVVGYAHRPSDVLASLLLVAAISAATNNNGKVAVDRSAKRGPRAGDALGCPDEAS